MPVYATQLTVTAATTPATAVKSILSTLEPGFVEISVVGDQAVTLPLYVRAILPNGHYIPSSDQWIMVGIIPQRIPILHEVFSTFPYTLTIQAYNTDPTNARIVQVVLVTDPEVTRKDVKNAQELGAQNPQPGGTSPDTDEKSRPREVPARVRD